MLSVLRTLLSTLPTFLLHCEWPDQSDLASAGPELTLDFSTGDSQFCVCRKDIPLDLLLNVVVTVI